MLHAKRACGSTWRKPRGDWREKKSGNNRSAAARVYRRVSPKEMELVLLPYSVACAFYDHLLTDHLRTTTYFEPEADWPQPIVSQNNLLISLQQLYLLGDTRSRRELLVFAEANAARLPLAMGIFANRYTYPAHGCENERQNLSWCLESVMPWRGIMGFTKFGDKAYQ